MLDRIYEATWGRAFAFGYDAFLGRSERAGLGDRRAELLAGVRGKVLELGAGTGVNLEHYPADLEELVLTEPSPHMARRLRARIDEVGARAEVVEASADQLPFPDSRFDTVVATLVLCTVPDPSTALAEAARVLRPDGTFLFLEHVRAEDPALARWQDRLRGPWKLFGAGCHCNRDTLRAVEGSPLEVVDHEHGQVPKAVPLVRPLLVGSARAPAATG